MDPDPATTAANRGAIPSIRGYLFQFAKVIELLLEPGASQRAVCVETFDDIAIDAPGEGIEIYQVKHQTHPFSLTTEKSLKMIQGWLNEPPETRFVFVSTQRLSAQTDDQSFLENIDAVYGRLAADLERRSGFDVLRQVLRSKATFAAFWHRTQWRLEQPNLKDTITLLESAARRRLGDGAEHKIRPWLAAVALSAADEDASKRRWTYEKLLDVDRHTDETRNRLLTAVEIQEMTDLSRRTVLLATNGREREALREAARLGASAVAPASPSVLRGMAAAVFAAHRSYPLGKTDGWTIADAAFSSDGTRIFTGGFNKYEPRVRIWDARSRSSIAQLQGHGTSFVQEIAVASDGRTFASAGDDGTAIVWDTQTGTSLHVLRHPRYVRNLMFSPDSATLLTCSSKKLFLWEVASGVCQASFDDDVVAAQFSYRGEIASLHATTKSSTLRLRDLHKASAAVNFAHPVEPRGLAFSPDGDHIITWSSDCEARLWHRTNGYLRGFHHMGRLKHAVFSPDGSRLVVCSSDGSARLWEVASGELVTVLHGHVGPVHMASYSPDGTLIVTASDDCDARVWTAQNGFPVGRLNGHKNAVFVARFSPSSKQIVTASEDGDARLWALPGEGLLNLRGHAKGFSCCEPSPDGSRVLTADGTVRIFDAVSGALLLQIAAGPKVSSACFLRNGSLIATRDYDAATCVWDATTGAKVGELEPGSTALCLSPTGELLAIVSSRRRITLWDVASLSRVVSMQEFSDDIERLAFSRDGSSLAAGLNDGVVVVCNRDTGWTPKSWQAHAKGKAVRAVALSHSGDQIVSVGDDEIGRLWLARTQQSLGTFDGHLGLIWDACFSPDGKVLLTASRDATARLWDVASRNEMFVLSGHLDQVRNVAFSPDGRQVMTASRDMTARIWDSATGDALMTVTHRGAIEDARYFLDGSRIVTASYDGGVQVHPVSFNGIKAAALKMIEVAGENA